MGMMRPNVSKLLRRGSAAPALTDTSLTVTSESRVGADPEEVGDFAIEPRVSDPPEPEENRVWLRRDREPPEIRLFVGGQTYAVPFVAVPAEPHAPLYPSASLRPPFYPRGE